MDSLVRRFGHLGNHNQRKQDKPRKLVRVRICLVGRIGSGVRVSASFHNEPFNKWTVGHLTMNSLCFNPFERRGNYNAASSDKKLVHWPLMGELLHLVQRGGDWAGPQPA